MKFVNIFPVPETFIHLMRVLGLENMFFTIFSYILQFWDSKKLFIHFFENEIDSRRWLSFYIRCNTTHLISFAWIWLDSKIHIIRETRGAGFRRKESVAIIITNSFWRSTQRYHNHQDGISAQQCESPDTWTILIAHKVQRLWEKNYASLE